MTHGTLKILMGTKTFSCSLSNALVMECENGSNYTDLPVFGSHEQFVGFVSKTQTLEQFNDDIIQLLGKVIASDFGRRYLSGEKRLFKCKRTETQALEFLMVANDYSIPHYINKKFKEEPKL